MSALYPEIEPYDHGQLDMGDGNLIYWEACGNPAGRPALVLHGGPGSGCSTAARRYFDPDAYRIILFDQRNCGRSLPSAADPKTDLSVNTTWHLVADIERLRTYLGIDSWLLFGNSWGSTLALAYGETHPERVAAIVLSGVTTTRRSEIDWLYRGMAPLFPEEWHRFRQAIPPGSQGQDEDMVAAYHRLLNDPDPGTRLKAARDWHDWEAASILLADPQGRPRRWADPAYMLTRARIIHHPLLHQRRLAGGRPAFEECRAAHRHSRYPAAGKARHRGAARHGLGTRPRLAAKRAQYPSACCPFHRKSGYERGDCDCHRSISRFSSKIIFPPGSAI